MKNSDMTTLIDAALAGDKPDNPNEPAPTPEKRDNFKRHRNFTKPPHNEQKAKKRRKLARRSRKINRK